MSVPAEGDFLFSTDGEKFAVEQSTRQTLIPEALRERVIQIISNPLALLQNIAEAVSLNNYQD
jgi:hypothetical protein